MPRKRPHRTPILGAGDVLGAGDSYLATDILPPELAEVAFEKLKTEVLDHPVNHVLIQFYRSGKDCISEHSDKTIDVVRGSNIVNVSLGAQRIMTLRLKRDKKDAASLEEPAGADQGTLDSTSGTTGTPRVAQRIPLPHNSMFVMGVKTNAKWLHAVNPDNRPLKTKSPEEQVEGGARISLTFRHIGTFLSKDEKRIWGQGAKSKTKEEAGLVRYDKEEVRKLLLGFGEENHKNAFDWEAAYGPGFDILHFKNKDSIEMLANLGDAPG
ncbi:unnamed protein product [Cyclocybe aegerita]|uniref:Fe2OG dioxygenase domain-containing protein n=1 Tax=Cyclocybe aegerita TaxID=1973307 RepID=A0A8S0XN77_CYCAE|nr:unnamed protein product [Cyclocybe aegerita]